MICLALNLLNHDAFSSIHALINHLLKMLTCADTIMCSDKISIAYLGVQFKPTFVYVYHTISTNAIAYLGTVHPTFTVKEQIT